MSCEEPKILPAKTEAEVIMHCLYHEDDDVRTPKSLAGMEIDCDFVSPKTGETLSSCSTANGKITILEGNSVPGDDPDNPGIVGKGRYTIHGGIAEGWPVGDMPVDVMYTRNDKPFYTEDFIMAFTKGRTKKDTR